MIYFKVFRITGVNNKVVYDDGIDSSKENPIRLLSVMVQVDDYQDNDIQGWLQREKVFEVPDSLLDTVGRESDNHKNKSFNRLNEIEVGCDVPVGATFKVAVSSGATKCDLIGAYRYEITE